MKETTKSLVFYTTGAGSFSALAIYSALHGCPGDPSILGAAAVVCSLLSIRSAMQEIMQKKTEPQLPKGARLIRQDASSTPR